MLKIQPGTAYLTSFYLVDSKTKAGCVEVASLSSPPDRAFPANAIVLPYGGKARAKLAAQLSYVAHFSKQTLYQIEIGVDIDRLSVKALTLDTLRTTCLMNINRIGKCVQATIMDYWCSYLEEEDKDIEWVITHLGRDIGTYVSSRPDLLGRLCQEKEFLHLNMIVFSLLISGESIDLGMILHKEAITQKICKTNPDMHVVLPEE